MQYGHMCFLYHWCTTRFYFYCNWALGFFFRICGDFQYIFKKRSRRKCDESDVLRRRRACGDQISYEHFKYLGKKRFFYQTLSATISVTTIVKNFFKSIKYLKLIHILRNLRRTEHFYHLYIRITICIRFFFFGESD